MDQNLLTQAYALMRKIRRFEEAINELYAQNLIRGSMHQSIGQEAIAAGIGLALEPEDKITATYRGHGHVIAKGTPLKPLMAEMLGRETGISRGRGGSMHFADLSRGVLPMNAIVAAGIPHAVGAAYTAKYLKQNWISVAVFGDGATNQGAFHESLTIASVQKLPVLFVCENNLYSEFTPIADIVPNKDLVERAQAYNMPAHIVNGNDVEEVYEAAKQAIGHIRAGKGPVFLEMKTYRLVGHMFGDMDQYRPPEEKQYWIDNDPVKKLAERLSAVGVDVQGINEEIESELQEAITFAKESPFPDPGTLFEGVYYGA